MAGEHSTMMDETGLQERRFRQLTVSRYRDRDRIREASEEIDRIRERVGETGESLAETVRRWRDERYAAGS